MIYDDTGRKAISRLQVTNYTVGRQEGKTYDIRRSNTRRYSYHDSPKSCVTQPELATVLRVATGIDVGHLYE